MMFAAERDEDEYGGMSSSSQTKAYRMLEEELVETRRKLSISQSLAEKMTARAREVREEATNMKRESGEAQQMQRSFQAKLDVLTEEKVRLVATLNETRSRLDAANEELTHVRSDKQAVIDNVLQLARTQGEEGAELRAKLTPLENEKRRLVEHVQELDASLQAALARAEEEGARRIEAEKRLKEALVVTDLMRSHSMEMQFAAQQANEQAEQHKANVEAHSATCEELHAQLLEADERCMDLSHQLDLFRAENQSLAHEIDAASEEMVSLSRLHKQEQEALLKRLDLSQEEAKTALEKIKRQCDLAVSLAQQKANEASDARMQADQKYITLQAQCNDMHTQMGKVLADQQATMLDWQLQRERLENETLYLKRSLKEAQEGMVTMQAQGAADKEAMYQSIRSVKMEMASRGEKYLASLSSYQASLKMLRDEATLHKSKQREMGSLLKHLATRIGNHKEASCAPLAALIPELCSVYKKLFSKLEGAKNNAEEHKDELRKARIEREAERGNTLAAEDVTSRLEREVEDHKRQVLEAQGNLFSQSQIHLEVCEKHAKEKRELSQTITQLQTMLEAASAKTSALHTSHQQAQQQNAILNAALRSRRVASGV